jgi:hypothetical protein
MLKIWTDNISGFRDGILVAFIILIVGACSEKNVLVNPPDGIGADFLTISTDATSYRWQPDGEEKDRKNVFIEGNLINDSNTMYYARVGDGFGGPIQTHILVAANSQAQIEYYNQSKEIWEASDLMAVLIEGSRMIQIAPSQSYSIHAHLIIREPDSISGWFRIRIDYFVVEDPDEKATIYTDYSNEFFVK